MDFYSETLLPSNSSKTLLVLNILEEQFGDQTKEIAKVLMTSCNPTLRYLIRHFKTLKDVNSRLTPFEIQNNLIMLQQHRCLIAEYPPLVDHIGNELVFKKDSWLLINIGNHFQLTTIL